jgi:hypothetical protein
MQAQQARQACLHNLTLGASIILGRMVQGVWEGKEAICRADCCLNEGVRGVRGGWIISGLLQAETRASVGLREGVGVP